MRLFHVLAGVVLLGGCAEKRVQPGAPASPEPPRSAPEEAIRTVAVGSVDILDLDFDPNPAPLVGNKLILEVLPGENPRQFKVVFLKKGTTSLLIQSRQGALLRKYLYNVITNDLSSKVTSIRSLLRGIDGISVYAADERIVIDGKVLEPKEMDRIMKVAEAYRGVAVNLVTIDPRLYADRAHEMETEIRKDPGGRNVRVQYLNDTYLLEGRVERQADRDRAEAIAQLLLPEIMARPAVREGVMVLGAKKYSIRNLIEVTPK